MLELLGISTLTVITSPPHSRMRTASQIPSMMRQRVALTR